MATPPSSPPRAPALCARFLGDHAKPEKPKPGSCSPQAVGIPRQQPRWAPHRPRAATTSASAHCVEPDYRLLREVVLLLAAESPHLLGRRKRASEPRASI